MEKVIQAPGQNKEILYDKVLNWYSETFMDPSSVITFNDYTLGKINGNFVSSYPISMVTRPFIHSIIIQLKDDRIKVTISNISNTIDGYTLEEYILKNDNSFRESALYKSVVEKLNSIIISLEKAIQTPEGADDSW